MDNRLACYVRDIDPARQCACLQVLTGEIPGDVLINMSAEELAPPEMRIKNEQVSAFCKERISTCAWVTTSF